LKMPDPRKRDKRRRRPDPEQVGGSMRVRRAPPGHGDLAGTSSGRESDTTASRRPAPFRFKWKREPHLKKDGVVWAYLRCRGGKLWFEREITAKGGTKYIHLGDPEVVSFLHARAGGFSVRGGRGAGIVIDSFEIPGRLRVKVVALREDWRAFENRARKKNEPTS
ncbi:MAG: hypothetical protein ACTSU5_17220, partial [Promethearchaeota archaeon]